MVNDGIQAWISSFMSTQAQQIKTQHFLFQIFLGSTGIFPL